MKISIFSLSPKKQYLLFPALLLLASVSHAALSQPVLNAISNVGGDLLAAITAVIGVMVVFWGINKLAYKFGFGGVPDVGERYAYYDKSGKLVEASWTKKDDGIHKRRHGS